MHATGHSSLGHLDRLVIEEVDAAGHGAVVFSLLRVACARWLCWAAPADLVFLVHAWLRHVQGHQLVTVAVDEVLPDSVTRAVQHPRSEAMQVHAVPDQTLALLQCHMMGSGSHPDWRLE